MPRRWPRFKHDRRFPPRISPRSPPGPRPAPPKATPADMPPAPAFAEEWALGTPDLVLELPSDFDVPAAGE